MVVLPYCSDWDFAMSNPALPLLSMISLSIGKSHVHDLTMFHHHRVFPAVRAVAVLFCLQGGSLCSLQARELEYGVSAEGTPDVWGAVWDGAVAGGPASGRMLDGFRISRSPIPLEFRCSSAMTGWRPWTPAGGGGASAPGNHLEAIQFRFSGSQPPVGKLYGRAHVAGIGWLRTLLIEHHVVLGATARGWRIDALQLKYAAGESGENVDLVARADAAFDRFLPAGTKPDANSATDLVEIFSDEPGIARWMWMSGKRETDFWVQANELAHQPTKVASWERLDTEDYPAYPPTYRMRWSHSDINTLTLNWNASMMTGENQNDLPVTAARVDGNNQLRAGQRPFLAIDKKLETLILPSLEFEETPSSRSRRRSTQGRLSWTGANRIEANAEFGSACGIPRESSSGL
jgi:hypothetical protein